MTPVDAQNSAIRGAILPKWEKTCLRFGRSAVQNFTPIRKAGALCIGVKFCTADKSLTVGLHKKKERRSKLSISPYTTYGG